MSAPPPGTVLQVQCGSCIKIVNVPAPMLEQLLANKMYSCPHCKSRQAIQLTAQQEAGVRLQARQVLAAAAAQQQQQQAVVQQRVVAALGQLAAQQQRPQQQPRPALTPAQQLAAYQAMAAAAAGGTARPAAPQPAVGMAPAMLQALQRMQGQLAAAAAGQPQQPQQQASRPQSASGSQPASAQDLPHSGSAAALQQMLQMQRQVAEHMQQKALAAAAAAGSRPAGLSRQQSGAMLAAVAQMQQQAAQQQRQLAAAASELNPDEVDDADESEVRDTFMEYAPAKLPYGQPHPDAVVETASLAAVEPPDITYTLKAHDELVASLSALQLESVVYACQRHQQTLPDGARGGFFIGDGAGVGKGRTIAGLILENWRQGRRKHLWLSVGSDLKIDAQRDLNDVGAADLPLHALNKLPYGKLAGNKIGVHEGVVFLTYSSLISSSERGHTRFKQLVQWCGPDYDGLIVFDESHKAKNLVPETGTRATQVGLKVRDLQLQLPKARVVYCSATGASEPRNMGYMVRLGLWGPGHPAFPAFPAFLEAVQGKGGGGANVAALELVAMDMKAQGMYVCRTLSFAGAEFQTIEAPLEEPIASQYAASAAAWNRLFLEFLAAEEAAAAEAAAAAEGAAPSGTTSADGEGVSGRKQKRGGDARSATWRSFWAAHQAFFRHMTMAAKVPAVVRMAKAAVAGGKCAVVGLQSTGEARTADVVADRGEALDDFVSGPKELLLRLVEGYYPMPPNPNRLDTDDEELSDEEFEGRGIAAVAEAAARNALEARDQTFRGAKARAIRYREFEESEEIGDTASSSSSEGEGEGEGKGRSTRKRSSSASASPSAAGAQAPSGSKARSRSKAAAAAAARRRTSAKPSSRSGSGGAEAARSSGAEAAGSSSGSDSGGSDDDMPQRSGSSGEEFDPSNDGASPSPSSSSSSSGSDSASGGGGGGEGAGSLNTQQREERRRQQEAREAERQARHAAAEQAYREALQRREALLEMVQQLELPSNPLDALIDQLGGPDEVAEMTGRKGRLVRSKDAAGVVFEARNASGVGEGATLEMINVHERELFHSGAKLIAIISEAASAGISLHADRRAANQRRRVHLTLELPWSADKAIQQLGRTHRANQAHAPLYRLIFTPLGGERRFAAAVARRLESLGALTQGDRRAGPSFSSFNYESVWGQRALRETYRAVTGERPAPLALPLPCRPGPDGEPPAMSLPAFLGRARALLLNVGIMRHNKAVVPAARLNQYLERPEGAPPSVGRIEEKDMADVPRFLNRLLGLAPAEQQALFDFYQATLEALMEKARQEGVLDEGIVDVKAHSVSLAGEPRVLHRDPVTGAKTVLHEIELDRGLPWPEAQQLLEQHETEAAAAAAGLALSPGAGAVTAVLASVPVDESAPQQQQQQQEQQPQGSGDQQPSAGALQAEQQEPQPSPAAANGSLKQQRQPASSAKRRRPAAEPAANADVVDLTLSDSEEDAAAAPAKRQRQQQGAEAADGEPAGAGAAAAGTGPWGSGFYRARQEGINKQVHVLLALQVPGSKPPAFAVHRPATGRTRKTMALQELKARYQPLAPPACRPLWDRAFAAADEGEKKEKRGGAVQRKKRLHILSGAVMRSWGAVQAALQKHVRDRERRMRVLRIATTGEQPQRLVGMLVPEPAVDPVVAVLSAAGADGPRGVKQEAAAPAEGGGAGRSGPGGGRGGKAAGQRHRRQQAASPPPAQRAAAASGQGSESGTSSSGSGNGSGGSETESDERPPPPRRLPGRRGRPANLKE